MTNQMEVMEIVSSIYLLKTNLYRIPQSNVMKEKVPRSGVIQGAVLDGMEWLELQGILILYTMSKIRRSSWCVISKNDILIMIFLIYL